MQGGYEGIFVDAFRQRLRLKGADAAAEGDVLVVWIDGIPGNEEGRCRWRSVRKGGRGCCRR